MHCISVLFAKKWQKSKVSLALAIKRGKREGEGIFFSFRPIGPAAKQNTQPLCSLTYFGKCLPFFLPFLIWQTNFLPSHTAVSFYPGSPPRPLLFLFPELGITIFRGDPKRHSKFAEETEHKSRFPHNIFAGKSCTRKPMKF